ncbi:hypothetical protein [Kitasatospora fiedleri]|uniref:hypothetical protein n=1 Tax=Kitasatospora fiedleri TaxID=2991545 RepID=UPI00249C037B|nr:hypothetical protein [Kitasatospora fiedleri]
MTISDHGRRTDALNADADTDTDTAQDGARTPAADRNRDAAGRPEQPERLEQAEEVRRETADATDPHRFPRNGAPGRFVTSDETPRGTGDTRPATGGAQRPAPTGNTAAAATGASATSGVTAKDEDRDRIRAAATGVETTGAGATSGAMAKDEDRDRIRAAATGVETTGAGTATGAMAKDEDRDRIRAAATGVETTGAGTATGATAKDEDRDRARSAAGQPRTADGSGTHQPLLPSDLTSQLTQRMDHAIGTFVDDPRQAVQEADKALDETVQRLTEGLRERRTALRDSWHADGDKNGERRGAADDSSRTEDLRLSLREYRDLLQQLLAV